MNYGELNTKLCDLGYYRNWRNFNEYEYVRYYQKTQDIISIFLSGETNEVYLIGYGIKIIDLLKRENELHDLNIRLTNLETDIQELIKLGLKQL